MPVQQIYKLKCPQCGFSKVVRLQSDVLSPLDVIHSSETCLKCGKQMKQVKMNPLDYLFSVTPFHK